MTALLLARVDLFGQERTAAPTLVDGEFWQYRVVEGGEYMTERELKGIYEISPTRMANSKFLNWKRIKRMSSVPEWMF